MGPEASYVTIMFVSLLGKSKQPAQMIQYYVHHQLKGLGMLKVPQCSSVILPQSRMDWSSPPTYLTSTSTMRMQETSGLLIQEPI